MVILPNLHLSTLSDVGWTGQCENRLVTLMTAVLMPKVLLSLSQTTSVKNMSCVKLRQGQEKLMTHSTFTVYLYFACVCVRAHLEADSTEIAARALRQLISEQQMTSGLSQRG